MIRLVKICTGDDIFYAVRWTWLGMFKQYFWLGSKQNTWLSHSNTYFREQCLTTDVDVARKELSRLTKNDIWIEEVIK